MNSLSGVILFKSLLPTNMCVLKGVLLVCEALWHEYCFFFPCNAFFMNQFKRNNSSVATLTFFLEMTECYGIQYKKQHNRKTQNKIKSAKKKKNKYCTHFFEFLLMSHVHWKSCQWLFFHRQRVCLESKLDRMLLEASYSICRKVKHIPGKDTVQFLRLNYFGRY